MNSHQRRKVQRVEERMLSVYPPSDRLEAKLAYRIFGSYPPVNWKQECRQRIQQEIDSDPEAAAYYQKCKDMRRELRQIAYEAFLDIQANGLPDWRRRQTATT